MRRFSTSLLTGSMFKIPRTQGTSPLLPVPKQGNMQAKRKPEAMNNRLEIPCVCILINEELRLNTGAVLMRTAFSHLEAQDF
jgi:hypothetical protein